MSGYIFGLISFNNTAGEGYVQYQRFVQNKQVTHDITEINKQSENQFQI